MYEYPPHAFGAPSNQKRGSDPLELELQTSRSCHVSAGNRDQILGTETRSYARVVSALTC